MVVLGEVVLRVFEGIGVVSEDKAGELEGLVLGGEDDTTRLRQITAHLRDLVHDARTQSGQVHLDVRRIHDGGDDGGGSGRGTCTATSSTGGRGQDGEEGKKISESLRDSRFIPSVWSDFPPTLFD